MAISFAYVANHLMKSPVTQNRICEILQATNKVPREVDSSHGQVYACARAGFDKHNQKMGSPYTIFVILEYFDPKEFNTTCIDLILGNDRFQVRCPEARPVPSAQSSWGDRFPPAEIVSMIRDVFDKDIFDNNPAKPAQPMNNPLPPSSSTQPSPPQLNARLNRGGARQTLSDRTGGLYN